MARGRGGLRHAVQLGFTILTNSYTEGFVQGKIYAGPLKKFCVPGLGCYSCPGALGACPVGALQAVVTSRQFDFSFYVAGFLVMVGALCGRFVCGWLCPFGLIQDLLYKLPFFRKRRKLPGDKALRYLRFVVLAVFVLLLPLVIRDITGQGAPWFCKLICPVGTLTAGVPLLLVNPALRSAAGVLFGWKLLVLLVIVLLSVYTYRPFCRYLCPLGAIYAPFNKFALYRYTVDEKRCNGCGACQKACKLDIPVYKTPNSAECIRCGDCRRACPTGCIRTAGRAG